MKTLGVMLDCSRNAVMKPEQVKQYAKLISDMGYNMLMLYTEDTYEIEGEPFFGHLRGRYSRQELKEMDQYCNSIGVELVPCIQTLAHLNQLKQWDAYLPMFDWDDILMAGDPRVYELIDKMFQTLSTCFSTRRIHVGMDEAHMVGRGRYQDKHGFRNKTEILNEHLSRVKDIADKYGFQLMIWSDMFIRLHNHGEYYADELLIPNETIAMVPEGVELIYWDYYSGEKKSYDSMFDIHGQFHNPIGFAGGLWTWNGYTPNFSKTWNVLLPAMQSVHEHNIENVFFTMWGDDGKECSFYTQLPMLYVASRMAQGMFDKEKIAKEFLDKYGYTLEEFMNLELPNLVKHTAGLMDNPSKYLLFNDPLNGKFDFCVEDGLYVHYKNTADVLKKSINGRPYDYIFEFQVKLSEVLAHKAELGVKIRNAYQAGDKIRLSQIADEIIPTICDKLEIFSDSFCNLWLKENKVFGLEVHEARFGALLHRMKMCRKRLLAYTNGEIKRIEELEENVLSLGDKFEFHNNWRSMITTGVL